MAADNSAVLTTARSEPLQQLQEHGSQAQALPEKNTREKEGPEAQRSHWILNLIGVGLILALCDYAETVLVVTLVAALLAFILAPVVDVFTYVRLAPRPGVGDRSTAFAHGGRRSHLFFFESGSHLFPGSTQVRHTGSRRGDALPQAGGELWRYSLRSMRKACSACARPPIGPICSPAVLARSVKSSCWLRLSHSSPTSC